MEAYELACAMPEGIAIMSLQRFVILHPFLDIPGHPHTCLAYFYQNSVHDEWLDPTQQGVHVNRPFLAFLKCDCVFERCRKTGERVSLDILRDLYSDSSLTNLELVHVPTLSTSHERRLAYHDHKSLRQLITEGLDIMIPMLTYKGNVSLCDLKAFLEWIPRSMPYTLTRYADMSFEDRQASKIKKGWKRAIADPSYPACKRRLLREFCELASP